MTNAADLSSRVTRSPDPDAEIDNASASLIHRENLGETRWGIVEQHVYRCRDGSLLAVEREKPATESVEIAPEESVHDAYEVEAVEVTITRYRPKSKQAVVR